MGTGRATARAGTFVKVTLGPTSKVCGSGKYSISGMVRKTVETSEFGDDVDQFEFATADGGNISLSDVVYDPDDAEQNTFRTNVSTVGGIKLINSTTTGPRFWINSTSYQTIGAAGAILLTSAGKVEADRSNVLKTSFEGKVSGAFMTLV